MHRSICSRKSTNTSADDGRIRRGRSSASIAARCSAPTSSSAASCDPRARRAAHVSDELEFHLANDLAAMADIAEIVQRFVAEHGLPAEAANALYVSVDEAVSNAIAHGYPEGRRGEIAVRLCRRPDSVVLEIEDDGLPFDPLQAPAPDLTVPLEQRPIGGLGIHLIRNLMDDVSYARRKGRNVLKLVKDLATT